jgi:ABC-type nitrate/sulfonate/bicarbonate transport system ATPase subunit
MSFQRKLAPRWIREIPGARWYKTDLHVHTIDDHPGNRVKLPPGVSLNPDHPEPAALTAYARAFLQSAVRVGVQVLGLTPHSPRIRSGGDVSAVWRIVEVWNEDRDDDGVLFREKIYAVFPGFEPNVNDGRSGVHLLFLFDPEIGKDAYLRLFDAVMGGADPSEGRRLTMTASRAKEVLETVAREHARAKDDGGWDYIVLAPHFEREHGLLREAKSQVLEYFPAMRLAGYELRDDALPGDFSPAEKPGSFLLPFMAEHSQAFFHASDAYRLPSSRNPLPGELGSRITWFKLACPRIEALRQAFLASESRLRIGYRRGPSGRWEEVDPPDPFLGNRPWLRRVTIRGKSAFFRDGTREDGSVTVELSPDLTCIIGGSMTGKSTLLDGLRVHTEAELPADDRLRADVEARGRDLFLAGQPQVELDTPGNTAGRARDRWPAQFFTQNELERLVREPGAIRSILARLVPGERDEIFRRDARILELDESLADRAGQIGELLDELAQAEQLLSGAERAQEALRAFEEAGLDELRSSERRASRLALALEEAQRLQAEAWSVARGLQEMRLSPELLDFADQAKPEPASPRAEGDAGGARLFQDAVRSAREAAESVARWAAWLERASAAAARMAASSRRRVERKLAEQGYGAEKLTEFKNLSSRASKLASYRAARDDVARRLGLARRAFDSEHQERNELIGEQRRAFDRIGRQIEERFRGKIRVRREEDRFADRLGEFLLGLKQKGITSWWNGLPPERRPSPERLVNALQQGTLGTLGCSATVARRLEEALGESRIYMLKALRNEDRYVLSLQVGERECRAIHSLSGGKRVSVMLSLLLDAHDERPLVIDQPEDQLDKRFMWETVLPALRRLKGRRQVIVATHDANIVVNGDADQVVLLEADADHGRVAVSGAIEVPEVRRAIIETVDGGARAFALRKAKYGF